VVDQVAQAGADFLNGCTDPNRPLAEQPEQLDQLAQQSQVLGQTPWDSQPYAPTTQLLDIDQDDEDEMILHTQLAYDSDTTAYVARSGLSVAYVRSAAGWQGHVIWPVPHFVDSQPGTYPTFATFEDYFETQAAWQADEALRYYPAPAVRVLDVPSAPNQPYLVLSGLAFTVMEDISETAILRWDEQGPAVLLRLAWNQWCGDYPWEINDDGRIYLPAKPAFAEHGCPAVPERVFVLGQSESFTTGPMPAPAVPAAECPQPTEEMWLLQHPEQGYCLLYPIEYRAQIGDQTSISIPGYPHTVDPFVDISVEPAGGRTAEEVADQLAADNMGFSDLIERATIIVGGEEAFVLNKLPGQDFWRAVFFVHDDWLYRLHFFPVDNMPGNPNSRSRALHDMVLGSFTFIPRPDEVVTECFAPKADMQLLRDGEQGYCLIYPNEYHVEQTNENETVLSIGSPLNVADPRLTIEVQDAAGRTAGQAGDEIVAEFAGSPVEHFPGPWFGFAPAEYLHLELPGQAPGRQVVVVHNDRLYKLTFTPADVHLGELYGRMEALFTLIINSFRFLPPPTSGACVNDSTFVLDVNMPDGTHVAPGASFTKTWRLQNSGACTWSASYRLTFVSGEQMNSPQSIPLGEPVLPGAEVDISIELMAPGSDGTYQGQWQLVAPDGTPFGAKPYVEIVVP
jgi:hypothetical protein